MAALLLLLVAFAHASVIPNYSEKLKGQDLVEFINGQQNFFKAELSKFTEAEMLARTMRGQFAKDLKMEEAEELKLGNDEIPVSFDARQKWGYCPSIGTVYDQSNCGSCWSFCTAETMSDRTCIATKKPVVLSVDDVLSCCPNCGDGCEGGYPSMAFRYWVSTGVCTGGAYGSTGDCKPYPFHPCGVHQGENYGSCPSEFRSPKCTSSCQQGYNVTYPEDRHFGSASYSLQNNVAAIQKEIMTNGPVASTFTVYSDFYQYKSGIYVHTGGSNVGGHCVKTIGWGVENGIPYWLVVNSWNSDWGENGLFRIIRGTNEVGFEGGMSAAMARV